MFRFCCLVITLICGLLAAPVSGLAQKTQGEARPATDKPELVDQFGRVTAEDRSARLDLLFITILNRPGSVGYIFLYCGKKCKYGEIESHQRGIEINTYLKKFDRSRLVVLNAEYREKFETEFWISPNASTAPRPESTVNIRNVIFSKSSTSGIQLYNCCDDYSDVWKKLKP